jgi:hypothetical protein
MFQAKICQFQCNVALELFLICFQKLWHCVTAHYYKNIARRKNLYKHNLKSKRATIKSYISWVSATIFLEHGMCLILKILQNHNKHLLVWWWPIVTVNKYHVITHSEKRKCTFYILFLKSYPLLFKIEPI